MANTNLSQPKKTTGKVLSSGQKSAAAVRAAQQTTQRNAALGTNNYGSGYAAANLPSQIKAKTAQTNVKQTGINAATLANQAKVAAIAKQVADAAKAAQLAAALKGTVQAQALANAAKSTISSPSTGGTSYSGGGGASGGGGVATPASVPATVAPSVVPSAPAVVPVTAGPGTNNTTGGSFTSTGGGGTYGQLERQRQSRGPRTGLSVTPEMLQAIARRRVGRA